MRRLERLKRLRELRQFPRLSGFIPDIEIVGQDDPQQVEKTQKPLHEWSGQVRTLLTTEKYRTTFADLVGAYRSRRTPDSRRKTIEQNLLELIGQQIHDLEDAEPHWTLGWGFWIGLTTMVFAGIAAWPVIRDWLPVPVTGLTVKRPAFVRLFILRYLFAGLE